MASGLTTSGGDAAGDKVSKRAAERTRLIEQRLRSTRGQVKWTELITAMLLFAAGSLGYLFVFVLLDHWIFSGGVGFWGRLVFLLAFFVGSGIFLFRAVGPLLTRRINPLYAARTIERGQPALKNSLVNFLMLRTRPQDVNPAVFRAIQRRAAHDLKDINPETVIDRSHLIKAGYVLMTVVAVCCMYTLISSKSPFRSAGRMFVPWADVEAPTRVAFSDVIPGDRRAFHDEFVDVSVLVQGIDPEEPVTLYYSTADGQNVDMPLAMTRPEDGFRHQVTLPPGSSGIQQNIDYYIVAGDARTRVYSIEVESAPAIIVDRVDYDYPDYTGLANRGQVDQGDILALEGTRVTISARANQPIVEAFVDFDCNGTRDLDMSVDGKQASVSFPLRLNSDRSGGEFESYELRFVNEEKQENPRPARHRIEVTADRPPEIEITQPGVDEIEVPVNAAVDIELRARDPDFKLSNVTVHARRQADVLLRQEMLEGAHEGEFSGNYRLSPADLGLKAGDEIVYWADARDNKRPTANRTQTIEYRLRVVDRAEEPFQKDPEQEEGGREGDREGRGEQPGGEQRNEQPPMPREENAPADENAEATADESAESAPGEESSQEGEQSGDSEPQERIDPDAQPGEAFEEILKHMEEQEQQKDQGEQQEQGSEGEGQQEEGQPQDDGGGSQSQDSGGKGKGQDGQSASEPSSEQSPSGGQEGEAGDQQSGGGEQSSEGGQQGDSSSGARQPSGGDDQQSTPGGQQKSSDPSDNASKQNSPGGSQSKSGGEGGQQSNDPSGTPQGSQSSGGEEASNQGQQSQAAKDGKPQGDQSGGQEGSDQGQASPAAKDGKPQGDQSGGQEGSDQGQSSPAAKDGSPKDDRSGSSGEDGDRNDSGRADEETSGEGGQTGGQGNEGSQEPSNESQKQGDPQGGDPEKANGSDGAGEKSEDDTGTGSKKGQQKPKDKSQETAPSDQEAAKDGASPESESGRESNSQGDNSGDKSGGGEEGAGQSADSEGTGSSGSNSAAEEGAGQSEGEGSGPTSNKPGDKQASKSGSNSSGEKAGGQGQPGEGGEASQGQPQQGGSGNSGSDQPMNGQQPPGGENQQQPGGSQQGGTPGGGNPGASQGDGVGQTAGGQEAGGNKQGASGEEAEQTADDANLDYAEQATDLALEHLRDQLDNGEPDQELLDRLQWTREDMERFVKYWEQLKRDAAQGRGDEPAGDDLREALQGLGLRRKSTQIDSGQSATDQFRQLRESRRTSPPPEYAEQFRHFTEGTSQRGANSNGSNN